MKKILLFLIAFLLPFLSSSQKKDDCSLTQDIKLETCHQSCGTHLSLIQYLEKQEEELQLSFIPSTNSKTRNKPNLPDIDFQKEIKMLFVQFSYSPLDSNIVPTSTYDIVVETTKKGLLSCLDDYYNINMDDIPISWEVVKIDLSNNSDALKEYQQVVLNGGYFEDISTGFLENVYGTIRDSSIINLSQLVINEANTYTPTVVSILFNPENSGSSNNTLGANGLAAIGSFPEAISEDRLGFAIQTIYVPHGNFNFMDLSDATTIRLNQYVSLIFLHEFGHNLGLFHSKSIVGNVTESSIMSESNPFPGAENGFALLEADGEYFLNEAISSHTNEEINERELLSNYLLEHDWFTVKETTSTINLNEVEIFLYPSLIEDAFTIENKSNLEIRKLEIYSIEGKKMKELGTSKSVFDISDFQSGLYLLNLTLIDEGREKNGTIKLFKK